MKASEYMNKKPETRIQAPRARFFTGDNVADIISKLISLAIIFLFISAGKWAIEAVVSLPSPATQAQVDSAVVRLVKPDTITYVKPDTLTIPVEYRYVDSHFVSNGDTTYWFLTGTLRGPNDFFQNVSRVIKLPYSTFNFYQAAENMKKGTKEANDAFIESFTQISKVTYLSYRKYAGHN